MSIKKIGDNWVLRVTAFKNGIREECKRKYPVSEFTKGRVEAESKRIKSELEAKIIRKLDSESPRLVRNIANKYLEEIEPIVRLSTYESRKYLIGKHLELFKDRNIEDVSASEVRQYIESLKLSMTTKKDIVKILKQVFQNAIDRRILAGENPLRRIYIDRAGANKPKNNKNLTMSPDDVDKLLKHLKSISSPWYEIFLVAYYTGTRASETQALQWEDVDFEKNLIYVSKTLQKNKTTNGSFGLTKNGEIRKVPISQTLKEFLLVKKEKENPLPKDFLLPRYSPWLKGRSAEYIREFQKELGIAQTNYHALRACFITHLLISGTVSESVIREMVGHKDWSTTRRYFKMCSEYLNGATSALDRKK